MPQKVSVITINYNMADNLAHTIESVASQSYPNLEYIVIDGGSQDASVKVIGRFQDKITTWVSEPDKGRYDAMNKGVAAATGEWIIFMNAGDLFHDTEVISDVFAQSRDDVDLLYGHARRVYPQEGLEQVVLAGPVSLLPIAMNCCHQSLFTRRTILRDRPFDTSLVIAADAEFMIWSKVSGLRFKLADRIVCIFSAGGISDKDRMRSLREQWKILRRHRQITPTRLVKFSSNALIAVTGGFFRRLLPPKVAGPLLRVKWALRLRHRPK